MLSSKSYASLLISDPQFEPCEPASRRTSFTRDPSRQVLHLSSSLAGHLYRSPTVIRIARVETIVDRKLCKQDSCVADSIRSAYARVLEMFKLSC